MKYNEQYLLNLTLQLVREAGINCNYVLDGGMNRRKTSYTPNEFYRWMHQYGRIIEGGEVTDVHFCALLYKMSPATLGHIVSLGISSKTPYRSVTLEHVIPEGIDLYYGSEAKGYLVTLALAVIAGCMWEMFQTERLIKFNESPTFHSGYEFRDYEMLKGMRQFVEKIVLGNKNDMTRSVTHIL